MEFEWKIFPNLTTMGILNQIQQMMENYCVNQRTSQAGSSSCQCLTTLCGMQKAMMKYVTTMQRQSNSMFVDSLAVIGLTHPGPGSEMKWYGTFDQKPDGSWDRTADKMLLNFAGSGHPVFRGTSALERGEIRSKVRGMKSIHFKGSTQNIELLLETVISVNQLCIYGAVADMIEELPVGWRAMAKSKAPGQLDKMETLTQPPLAETQATEERQGNLLQEYEQRRPEVIYAPKQV